MPSHREGFLNLLFAFSDIFYNCILNQLGNSLFPPNKNTSITWQLNQLAVFWLGKWLLFLLFPSAQSSMCHAVWAMAIKWGSYLLWLLQWELPLQQCENIADCWSLMARFPSSPGLLTFTDKICRGFQEEGCTSNKGVWGASFHWAFSLRDWCSAAGLIHHGSQCWDKPEGQRPRIYQFRVLPAE